MPLIHPKTYSFLSSLKKNNNKIWFDKNKPLYEEIKESLIEFAAALIKEMSKVDSSVASQDPKKSVMRIYRDIRFSKDKTPYKNNFAIGISASGKMGEGGGYYIHIEPGSNFIGGGIWMPEPKVLNAIRQEIDYNFKDFKKIVESASFKKTFGKLDEEMKLSRPPKGYEPDNAAIEYLKLKSFVTGAQFKDAQVLSSKFLNDSLKTFKELHPFLKFLGSAVV